MKRVTYKTVGERKNNQDYSELPKLKDILVDLSVKKEPKVVRKLRLIGTAMTGRRMNPESCTSRRGSRATCISDRLPRGQRSRYD